MKIEKGLHFSVNLSGCLSSKIGEYGLDQSATNEWLKKIAPHLDRLRGEIKEGTLEFARIAERRDDIEEARQALKKLSYGARDLIFFGTGGSSLGGQTLTHFSEHFIPDCSQTAASQRPNVIFYENLDPTTLQHVLDRFCLSTTRFIVISKSGETVETLFQFLAALQAVKRAGLDAYYPQMFLVITEPNTHGNPNSMHRICETYDIPILAHPPAIGGRFSVFSVVGILPAIARGVDVDAFRRGAQNVVDIIVNADRIEDCAPAASAAIATGLAELHNIDIRVMMPYADRLARYSNWFVQLWAESLGKDEKGSTPIAALGPVDQHSQLQLLLAGPRRHLVTLVTQCCQRRGPVIGGEFAKLLAIEELRGRSVGDIVNAEQRAVYQALIETKRPVIEIKMPEITAENLGELMMYSMMETVLTAYLIGVDPFDQPAVEIGKCLTRKFLQKTHKDELV